MTNQKFISKSTIEANGIKYNYFSLPEVAKKLNRNIDKLPYSLKILLENLVRNFDDQEIKQSHITSLIDSVNNPNHRIEIAFSPTRVLMQDFTGVPAVVDLAAMRQYCFENKKDANKINPLVPVDLVIDHSLQVDHYGSRNSLQENVDLEFTRNNERYEFLKWAQESFNNFRVVPPGTGICHQVNLENLAKVVWSKDQQGDIIAYPDSVVGTDSHTTMINGLAVLGWGVGGIEAEAAMLGQPISMLIPEVIGFKLTGSLQEGVTATDLVLTITNILRKKSVVGKFVEFCGPALANLTLADRATIANMAPEYGATCGIFPIDQETIKYLELTARKEEDINLVINYAKAQKLFVENYNDIPDFSDLIELDISTIKASLAGPKRPQDKINLSDSKTSFINFAEELKINNSQIDSKFNIPNLNSTISNGDIVIAAITSCTNTSNPSVLISAGLLAKKAVEKGLKVPNYIKTSLAPGSQVVSQYLSDSGLQQYLDQLGFNIVGYGCTTCIGNSGNLLPEIEQTIKDNNIAVSAILSGNRNFEGRVHPLVKANYLASPPLVVAFAIAGTIKIDLNSQPIGFDNNNKAVYLRDIWPSKAEIDENINKYVNKSIFNSKYSNLFSGNQQWQSIKINKSNIYQWNESSSYIRLPNFFDKNNQAQKGNINNANILAIFGDSITTDHISPAGNISSSSVAAKYLQSLNIATNDFNSYGARRGNHQVMVRGTFANIRIKNEILKGEKEGGFTIMKDEIGKKDAKIISIYEAAMNYQQQKTPLVIFAGKEYGTGSSRDWAAKGTFLLGIKAVIAESFERIHRSNLIGMGVLPLIFKNNDNRKNLNLTGNEIISLYNLENITPKQDVECKIQYADGSSKIIQLTCGIDTSNEVSYYNYGGILQYVMNQITQQ